MSLVTEGLSRGWGLIKKYASRTRGRFPSRLPIYSYELQPFIESILDTYGLPKKDSYVRAISTMVLHLGPTVAHKSKHWFALAVKKAMANEVAFNLIEEIKEREKKEAERKRQDTLDVQATAINN